MKQEYSYNPAELTQSKITFWFYVASIPIIAFFAYGLPLIRGEMITFSPYTTIYTAIIAVILFMTYRAYRVMHAIQMTACTVTDNTISGVSIPTPYRRAASFTLQRSEVLSVARKQVSVGVTRTFSAVVLNTKDAQYVLFAIEKANELIETLQN